ncbi:helicase SNF2 [Lewinellaceae bacterium SD302]|nr:helicase SNF2 [Lewinellaceae bacterium SD302]
MPETATDQQVSIVYNLFEIHPGIYAPEAYVISSDVAGLLAHVQQKATAETIGAFHLELTPEHQRCFTLIEELQVPAITLAFKGKARKVPKLTDLLALTNKEQRPAVQRYVHRRLDELINIIVEQAFQLTLNLERRVLAKDFTVKVDGTALQPLLSFDKQEKGVHYRFELQTTEGDRLNLRHHNIIPLTNHPAPGWLLIDRQLHRVAHLNGYVVKPFLTKDEVVIPAAQVTKYFKTFIAKVVSKVAIEAEGFAVTQKQQLLACRLEATLHPLEDRYYLFPRMDYGQASFGWNEKREQQTLLDLEGEEVSITRIQRNPAQETAFIRKLERMNLQTVPSTQFFLPERKNVAEQPLGVLQWLIDNRFALNQAGFHVPHPVVDGDKPMSLQSGQLTVNVVDDRDWFDLRGEVKVGDFRIPFARIAKYIRKGERLYPLPNGRFFLIPLEWSARYEEILRFAQVERDQVKLTKSHYTLLDQIAPELASPEEARKEAENFTPSDALKATLRPYQLAGAQWLVQHHHQGLGACLADDMGLGKTLQTIAVLLYAKEQLTLEASEDTATAGTPAPQLDLFGAHAAAEDEEFLAPLRALIVLPASLVYNWESEIKKFAPSLTTLRHTGQKRLKDVRVLRRYDVILTTYQTALRDKELLENLDFNYIILDESQQIKNRQSKVFKAVNELNAAHKISLSGTPIENSLSDLWSQMQFLNPGLLKSYNFFKKEFIQPIEKADSEEKKQQLRQLVAPYLLRRTKGEVAKDLPELHIQHFFCEMAAEQRRRYEKEKSAARNHLLKNFAPGDGQYRMLVVQTLTRLRQLANHPALLSADYGKGSGKFDEVMEQWEVIRKSGHKALFFSSFVTHLELFKKAFDEKGYSYAWISGSVTAAKRAAEVKRFQENDDLQAFFISIKSGGTGLNLTAADYVFVLDPWWNPTIEQQAIARAHRIGREGTVFARKYISKDTIEEKIVKLQEKKAQLAEDIIGKNGKLDFDKRELEFLLE